MTCVFFLPFSLARLRFVFFSYLVRKGGTDGITQTHMSRTARSKAFYLFLPLRNTLANRYVVYKEKMTRKWPVKWPLPSSHLTTNPLMNDISLTRFRFDVQQLVSI